MEKYNNQRLRSSRISSKELVSALDIQCFNLSECRSKYGNLFYFLNSELNMNDEISYVIKISGNDTFRQQLYPQYFKLKNKIEVKTDSDLGDFKVCQKSNYLYIVFSRSSREEVVKRLNSFFYIPINILAEKNNFFPLTLSFTGSDMIYKEKENNVYIDMPLQYSISFKMIHNNGYARDGTFFVDIYDIEVK